MNYTLAVIRAKFQLRLQSGNNTKRRGSEKLRGRTVKKATGV